MSCRCRFLEHAGAGPGGEDRVAGDGELVVLHRERASWKSDASNSRLDTPPARRVRRAPSTARCTRWGRSSATPAARTVLSSLPAFPYPVPDSPPPRRLPPEQPRQELVTLSRGHLLDCGQDRQEVVPPPGRHLLDGVSHGHCCQRLFRSTSPARPGSWPGAPRAP